MAKSEILKYKEEFIKLYNEGYSLRRLSAKYGINKGAIANLIRDSINIRPKSKYPTKESAQPLYDAYQQGLSVNEISKKFDENYKVVAVALRNHFNIITQKREKYIDMLPLLIKDYKAGLSLTELQNKYGINRATIHDYLSDVDMTMFRSYAEASRVYDLTEDYFNELDNTKAIDLGIIFATGTSWIYNTTYILEVYINEDYAYILDNLIKRLYINDCPDSILTDNTIKYRISSKDLVSTVLNYGLKSKNINIENKFLDKFMYGFIEGSLKISKKYVYIAYQYEEYTEFIINYLVGKGIDKEAIRKSKITASIIIERYSELYKLIDIFPNIIPKIQKYIDINNDNCIANKWFKILKKVEK